MPLNFHYKGGRVKCDIALAKGKKLHDKRETEKKRDWERERPHHARRHLTCATTRITHDTARSKRAVFGVR